MTDIAGMRLKKLREEKGWSLRELESRSSINYSVISRIESGQRPLYGSEAVKFSNLFNVSTDYLLGRTDVRNFEKKPEGEMFFWDLENTTPEEIEEAKRYIEFRRQQINKGKKK